MGVTQNVGDVIQVTLLGRWHNQQVQSILKYTVSALSGSVTTGFFATAIDTKFKASAQLYPLFLACCPPEYFLANVRIQTIAPVRVVQDIFPNSTSGSYAQHSSTANLAAVITKYGGLANKHNRGALHIPLANLDPETSNGTISNGMLTAMNTLATYLFSDVSLTAGVITPVLLRSKGTTGQAVPIVNAISQLTVRTMRSRTVGHGK